MSRCAYILLFATIFCEKKILLQSLNSIDAAITKCQDIASTVIIQPSLLAAFDQYLYRHTSENEAHIEKKILNTHSSTQIFRTCVDIIKEILTTVYIANRETINENLEMIQDYEKQFVDICLYTDKSLVFIFEFQNLVKQKKEVLCRMTDVFLSLFFGEDMRDVFSYIFSRIFAKDIYNNWSAKRTMSFSDFYESTTMRFIYDIRFPSPQHLAAISKDIEESFDFIIFHFDVLLSVTTLYSYCCENTELATRKKIEKFEDSALEYLFSDRDFLASENYSIWFKTLETKFVEEVKIDIMSTNVSDIFRNYFLLKFGRLQYTRISGSTRKSYNMADFVRNYCDFVNKSIVKSAENCKRENIKFTHQKNADGEAYLEFLQQSIEEEYLFSVKNLNTAYLSELLDHFRILKSFNQNRFKKGVSAPDILLQAEVTNNMQAECLSEFKKGHIQSADNELKFKKRTQKNKDRSIVQRNDLKDNKKPIPISQNHENLPQESTCKKELELLSDNFKTNHGKNAEKTKSNAKILETRSFEIIKDLDTNVVALEGKCRSESTFSDNDMCFNSIYYENKKNHKGLCLIKCDKKKFLEIHISEMYPLITENAYRFSKQKEKRLNILIESSPIKYSKEEIFNMLLSMPRIKDSQVESSEIAFAAIMYEYDITDTMQQIDDKISGLLTETGCDFHITSMKIYLIRLIEVCTHLRTLSEASLDYSKEMANSSSDLHFVKYKATDLEVLCDGCLECIKKEKFFDNSNKKVSKPEYNTTSKTSDVEIKNTSFVNDNENLPDIRQKNLNDSHRRINQGDEFFNEGLQKSAVQSRNTAPLPHLEQISPLKYDNASSLTRKSLQNVHLCINRDAVWYLKYSFRVFFKNNVLELQFIEQKIKKWVQDFIRFKINDPKKFETMESVYSFLKTCYKQITNIPVILEDFERKIRTMDFYHAINNAKNFNIWKNEAVKIDPVFFSAKNLPNGESGDIQVFYNMILAFFDKILTQKIVMDSESFKKLASSIAQRSYLYHIEMNNDSLSYEDFTNFISSYVNATKTIDLCRNISHRKLKIVAVIKLLALKKETFHKDLVESFEIFDLSKQNHELAENSNRINKENNKGPISNVGTKEDSYLNVFELIQVFSEEGALMTQGIVKISSTKIDEANSTKKNQKLKDRGKDEKSLNTGAKNSDDNSIKKCVVSDEKQDSVPHRKNRNNHNTNSGLRSNSTNAVEFEQEKPNMHRPIVVSDNNELKSHVSPDDQYLKSRTTSIEPVGNSNQSKDIPKDVQKHTKAYRKSRNKRKNKNKGSVIAEGTDNLLKFTKDDIQTTEKGDSTGLQPKEPIIEAILQSFKNEVIYEKNVLNDAFSSPNCTGDTIFEELKESSHPISDVVIEHTHKTQSCLESEVGNLNSVKSNAEISSVCTDSQRQSRKHEEFIKNHEKLSVLHTEDKNKDFFNYEKSNGGHSEVQQKNIETIYLQDPSIISIVFSDRSENNGEISAQSTGDTNSKLTSPFEVYENQGMVLEQKANICHDLKDLKSITDEKISSFNHIGADAGIMQNVCDQKLKTVSIFDKMIQTAGFTNRKSSWVDRSDMNPIYGNVSAINEKGSEFKSPHLSETLDKKQMSELIKEPSPEGIGNHEKMQENCEYSEVTTTDVKNIHLDQFEPTFGTQQSPFSSDNNCYPKYKEELNRKKQEPLSNTRRISTTKNFDCPDFDNVDEKSLHSGEQQVNYDGYGEKDYIHEFYTLGRTLIFRRNKKNHESHLKRDINAQINTKKPSKFGQYANLITFMENPLHLDDGDLRDQLSYASIAKRKPSEHLAESYQINLSTKVNDAQYPKYTMMNDVEPLCSEFFENCNVLEFQNAALSPSAEESMLRKKSLPTESEDKNIAKFDPEWVEKISHVILYKQNIDKVEKMSGNNNYAPGNRGITRNEKIPCHENEHIRKNLRHEYDKKEQANLSVEEPIQNHGSEMKLLGGVKNMVETKNNFTIETPNEQKNIFTKSSVERNENNYYLLEKTFRYTQQSPDITSEMAITEGSDVTKKIKYLESTMEKMRSTHSVTEIADPDCTEISSPDSHSCGENFAIDQSFLDNTSENSNLSSLNFTEKDLADTQNTNLNVIKKDENSKPPRHLHQNAIDEANSHLFRPHAHDDSEYGSRCSVLDLQNTGQTYKIFQNKVTNILNGKSVPESTRNYAKIDSDSITKVEALNDSENSISTNFSQYQDTGIPDKGDIPDIVIESMHPMSDFKTAKIKEIPNRCQNTLHDTQKNSESSLRDQSSSSFPYSVANKIEDQEQTLKMSYFKDQLLPSSELLENEPYQQAYNNLTISTYEALDTIDPASFSTHPTSTQSELAYQYSHQSVSSYQTHPSSQLPQPPVYTSSTIQPSSGYYSPNPHVQPPNPHPFAYPSQSQCYLVTFQPINPIQISSWTNTQWQLQKYLPIVQNTIAQPPSDECFTQDDIQNAWQ